MSAFRAAIEARNIDAAVALLADDVVLRSPAVFREYRGRSVVEPLLRAVAQVLEDLHYLHEYRTADGRSEALQFRATAGDRQIEGCDFVTWDESGSITTIVVMMRPLTGLTALVDGMRA